MHVHGELFASRCEACGSRVDHVIPDEAAEAQELRVAPPRFGTSGLVHPAASLPGIAKARGACIAEVNPDETALSAVADASLRMTATEFATVLEA